MPRPTTVIDAVFCRANCSTPGASRLHCVQCGAQNHTSRAFFPSKAEASANGFDDFTSVTLNVGSGFAVFSVFWFFCVEADGTRVGEASAPIDETIVSANTAAAAAARMCLRDVTSITGLLRSFIA